jgi:hypothetical protein
MPVTELAARTDIYDVVSEGTVQNVYQYMPTVDVPGSFIVVDIDSQWTPDSWSIPVRIFTPLYKPSPAEAMESAVTLGYEYEGLLKNAGYLTQGQRDVIVDREVIVTVLTVTVYREDF